MGIFIRTFILITIYLLHVSNAQIPSFGGCPNFEAVKDFDRERFLGMWYESERYFTFSELIAKCISANYERRADNKIYVNNAYTNILTGVQRIISGSMRVVGKTNEGLFTIRYQGIPVSYDTTLKVLDTDYDSYAVIWSCSGNPIAHTQSVWVMTRDRLPVGAVLQRAYGVLDKFKISRTYVVKTDQRDCETLPLPVEAIDPTTTAKPIKKNKLKPTSATVIEVVNTELKKLDVEKPIKPIEKVIVDKEAILETVKPVAVKEELREVPELVKDSISVKNIKVKDEIKEIPVQVITTK